MPYRQGAVTKYTPPCCRSSHVWYVKQNRRSKYSNKQAYNRLALLDLEHKYFNNCTKYGNVAYDSLTYKMASATLTRKKCSKWRHCRLMHS